jgi:hypothetical protein
MGDLSPHGTRVIQTGMRDLALRSWRHGAALGNQGDAAAAMLEAGLETSR